MVAPWRRAAPTRKRDGPIAPASISIPKRDPSHPARRSTLCTRLCPAGLRTEMLLGISQPVYDGLGRVIGYTGQPVQVCPGYVPPATTELPPK
jgi:hypothetical protein